MSLVKQSKSKYTCPGNECDIWDGYSLAAINCWVIMSWWHCLSMIIWKCIRWCPCTCIHLNITIYIQNLSNVMLRSISITSFIIHGKLFIIICNNKVLTPIKYYLRVNNGEHVVVVVYFSFGAKFKNIQTHCLHLYYNMPELAKFVFALIFVTAF